jgi:hypothetical protein
MNWDDETLGAFVDGETDAATTRAIEAALDTDAELMARFERMTALRGTLADHFNPVLSEDMPDALIAQVRSSAPSASAAAREERGLVARLMDAFSPNWVPVAAALLIGVGAGWFGGGQGTDTPVTVDNGQLVAGGSLARLLDQAGPAQNAEAATQLAFLNTDGRYCRTFTLEASAGIACRAGETWQVDYSTAAGPAATGTIRTASASLPLALLDQVDAWIAGDPLSEDEEAEAAAAGWQAGPGE